MTLCQVESAEPPLLAKSRMGHTALTIELSQPPCFWVCTGFIVLFDATSASSFEAVKTYLSARCSEGVFFIVLYACIQHVERHHLSRLHCAAAEACLRHEGFRLLAG